MATGKTKSSSRYHYAYHRKGPLSFHPCYLTSITAIIGVIKRIWLHKSGFRSLPVSPELGNGGNAGEWILSLGRLAGVRADARRVCRSWIMALQKSAKVEHGGLSPWWKEHGSLSRLRFPRRKVFQRLFFFNCQRMKSVHVPPRSLIFFNDFLKQISCFISSSILLSYYRG